MVLQSHVEVKSIPSVDKADSNESSAAWRRRKSKGWNHKAVAEEGWDNPSHTPSCLPPPSRQSWDLGGRGTGPEVSLACWLHIQA